MNPQHGPTRIVIDEPRCGICLFHTKTMLRSGRNPIYSNHCTHPASMAFVKECHFEPEKGRPIGFDDITPSWCPVIQKIPTALPNDDRHGAGLGQPGRPDNSTNIAGGAMTPTRDGHYWMRVRPYADWQIVQVSTDPIWKVRWFRADCLSLDDFESAYPDADWSKRITIPSEPKWKVTDAERLQNMLGDALGVLQSLLDNHFDGFQGGDLEEVGRHKKKYRDLVENTIIRCEHFQARA